MASILLLIGSKNCPSCTHLSLISEILRSKASELLLEIIDIDLEELDTNSLYKNLNIKNYCKWTPNIILISADSYFKGKKIPISQIKIFGTRKATDKLPSSFELNCSKIYSWIEENYDTFGEIILNIE